MSVDSKDEIKQKIDIVELIGEYLQLKPAGTHGFKAVCPFHSEKTPSFHVSSDRQIWHCFGCSEGGDCFSFVMKMEGMDFTEALMHLGQKAGVEVKRISTTEGNVKHRLYEINDLAARYYQKVFEQSSAAEIARSYVERRGVPPELVAKFSLGYATDLWDTLIQFLLKRGYSETEIVTAGLGQKKQNGIGLIDRFRSRLMIPLRDQHGKTVGFTGRIIKTPTPGLDEDQDRPGVGIGPKYMNSPETPVYHKGQLLFGLDMAKRACKEAGSIIIVEGNLDVVASHKAGVEQVVASSGTALTQDQLQLLSRYTKTLVFCFDQDAAGLIAAKRGITIARSLGFDIRALLLPDGYKDPDELVQRSSEKWKEITLRSIPIMQYLIELVTKGKDLSNVDHKRLVSKELVPALSEITDFVEQEHWIGQVATLLGIDVSQLRSMLRPMDKKSVHAEKSIGHSRHSKEEQTQFLLMGLAMNDPSAHGQIFKMPMLFTGELYSLAQSLYNSASYAPTQSFFSRLRDSLQEQERDDLIKLLDHISLLAEQTFSSMSPKEVQEQVKILESVLRRAFTQRKREEIAKKIRQAEQDGDADAVRRILQELQELKDVSS